MGDEITLTLTTLSGQAEAIVVSPSMTTLEDLAQMAGALLGGLGGAGDGVGDGAAGDGDGNGNGNGNGDGDGDGDSDGVL